MFTSSQTLFKDSFEDTNVASATGCRSTDGESAGTSSYMARSAAISESGYLGRASQGYCTVISGTSEGVAHSPAIIDISISMGVQRTQKIAYRLI